MSSKLPIAYMDIRVFAHATEDLEKVQTAVRNLLPKELADPLLFQKTSLTGHHGNHIILFTTKLEDKKSLPAILQRIGVGLSSLDKEELDRKIKLHIEKGNLYLRFDKQSAFMGEFQFTQNDPVHLRVHFKNKTTQEIADFCRQAGLLP